MKLLLLICLLATPAVSQSFDLTTLPKGYQFTDHGNDGDTTVRYLGQDETGYLFSYERDASQNDPASFLSWANGASQLIRWEGDGAFGEMAPHDCWPKLGDCAYEVTYSDGNRYQMLSNMYVKDGIWFHQRYVEVDGEPVFFERACTRMDEYGFPIDFYAEYWDGKTEWAERVTTMGQPDPRSDLESLRSLCETQPDMVS